MDAYNSCMYHKRFSIYIACLAGVGYLDGDLVFSPRDSWWFKILLVEENWFLGGNVVRIVLFLAKQATRVSFSYSHYSAGLTSL